MGYTAPTWVNGKPPAINATRLNELCSTVQTLDETMPMKQDKLTFDNVPTSGSSNPVKSSGIYTALQGKQSSLTFDSAPTQGSSNPVTSGGLYTALAGKQGTLTFDSTPTQGSTNPVTSGGVYSHRVVAGQKEGETLGAQATSEGANTVASGDNSHAEGHSTVAVASASHAEGNLTVSVGSSAHAEGIGNSSNLATINGPINADETTYQVGTAAAVGLRVGFAVKGTIGSNSYFSSIVSKSGGAITLSNSLNPGTALTSSDTLTIFRIDGVAFADGSHSEGLRTVSSGPTSHSEGTSTVAKGSSSHSEGAFTNSIGDYCHSEGNATTASGNSAHSEGANTTASGDYSHSEGQYAKSIGNNSHAEGWNTTASHKSQHVFGECNTPDPSTATADSRGTYVEIVGNGTSASSTSNARTLDWSGNEWIAGTLTQSSDSRLKTVEGEIPDVSEVHAVRFRWNDVNGQHDDIDHVGYIAQDVEKVAPFMVKEDSNGYKALDYIAFLCAKMELLERRVKELEEKKE